MSLVLEIMNAPSAVAGMPVRKVFHDVDGSIGRLPENDWMLHDPQRFISGRHAWIRFERGQYFIEDVSSNGVFLNAPESRLARGQLHPLKTGDRIYIEPYEISVSISGAPSSVPHSSHGGDPFQPASQVRSPPREASASDPLGQISTRELPRHSHSGHCAPISQQPDAKRTSREGQDVLQVLGIKSGSQKSNVATPRAAQLVHQSPLNDFYAPVVPVVASSSTVSELNPRPPAPPDYDPMNDEPSSAVSSSAWKSAERTQPVPAVTRAAEFSNAPISDDNSAQFAEFLQAAGLADIADAPQLAHTCGLMLRAMLEGAMQVLRAREKFKDEFRIRATRLAPRNNNPIKFSGNVEEALHNLLARRSGAYKSPLEAIEEVFQDLSNHQAAILAGMQRAFDSLLDELDPAKMEADFERQSRRSSLLAASAKSRYWELFCERHAQMVRDRNECFQKLFGYTFMKAYEQQLDAMRQALRQASQPADTPPP
jgi:type VI secretion system FHA domain protein